MDMHLEVVYNGGVIAHPVVLPSLCSNLLIWSSISIHLLQAKPSNIEAHKAYMHGLQSGACTSEDLCMQPDMLTDTECDFYLRYSGDPCHISMMLCTCRACWSHVGLIWIKIAVGSSQLNVACAITMCGQPCPLC